MMTSRPDSLLYPKLARAEVADALANPQETDALLKLKEITYSNTGETRRLVAGWKGRHVWLQGPRGSQRSLALGGRISETAGIFNANGQPASLLLIVPYNRQAEHWRLWAQEHKINLIAQVPETFTHSIASEFFESLGYPRPPEWAGGKIKHVVESTWEEMKALMNTLIDKTGVTVETKKIGNCEVVISQPIENEFLETRNTNDLQCAGIFAFPREFFSKISNKLKDCATTDIPLANYVLNLLLEGRPDIRNTVSRRFAALFIEEPEAMDQSFLIWFTRIAAPIQNIHVTSTYSLKSKNNLYPRLINQRAKPDVQDISLNLTFLGIPLRMWRESHLYKHTRGCCQDTISIASTPKGTEIKFNRQTAANIIENDLVPASRLVHITLEPGNARLNTGAWVASNILLFHEFKKANNRYFQRRRETNNPTPFLFQDGLVPDDDPLQIFLAIPRASHASDPSIEQWRDYLANAFPALRKINLDIKYLSLSDGPMETPPIDFKPGVFSDTVWIGTPLALNGCEFDIVIIPSLEIGQWPAAESTAWDWLDLCVSKARIATLALARQNLLASHFKSLLPISVKNTPIAKTTQAKLYFEPLFKDDNTTSIFGA